MKISISARTDVGKRREENEDDLVFCSDLERLKWNSKSSGGYFKLGKLGALAVVADGMGGANAGETASRLAIESIKGCFCCDNLEEVSRQSIALFMQKSIKEADEAILKRVVDDPETIGMGTTIVMAWCIGHMAYVAWCGDSRCYVFNPKCGLKCLTKDHSYVQELVDKGELSVDETYSHPDSNVITRCLGDTDSPSDADFIEYEMQPNDTLLLCSDGLCGYCKDKIIEDVMYRHISNVDGCCQALIETALAAGGYDNTSVLLMSMIADGSTRVSVPVGRKISRFFRFR